jgi:hypothetical protein
VNNLPSTLRTISDRFTLAEKLATEACPHKPTYCHECFMKTVHKLIEREQNPEILESESKEHDRYSASLAG